MYYFISCQGFILFTNYHKNIDDVPLLIRLWGWHTISWARVHFSSIVINRLLLYFSCFFSLLYIFGFHYPDLLILFKWKKKTLKVIAAWLVSEINRFQSAINKTLACIHPAKLFIKWSYQVRCWYACWTVQRLYVADTLTSHLLYC